MAGIGGFPEHRSIQDAVDEYIADRKAKEAGQRRAAARDLLLVERVGVIERLEKLAKHLYDARVDGTLSAEDLELLKAQRDIMIDYVDVLDERISRLK